MSRVAKRLVRVSSDVWPAGHVAARIPAPILGVCLQSDLSPLGLPGVPEELLVGGFVCEGRGHPDACDPFGFEDLDVRRHFEGPPGTWLSAGGAGERDSARHGRESREGDRRAKELTPIHNVPPLTSAGPLPAVVRAPGFHLDDPHPRAASRALLGVTTLDPGGVRRSPAPSAVEKT